MEMAKTIKKADSNIDLIVGNVASANAVESLIDCGADAVKLVLVLVLACKTIHCIRCWCASTFINNK